MTNPKHTSSHGVTLTLGEPLPEEMFKRLKAAKNFRSGTTMLRQVGLNLESIQ
jgi:Zn-dependent oligopeptidase